MTDKKSSNTFLPKSTDSIRFQKRNSAWTIIFIFSNEIMILVLTTSYNGVRVVRWSIGWSPKKFLTDKHLFQTKYSHFKTACSRCIIFCVCNSTVLYLTEENNIMQRKKCILTFIVLWNFGKMKWDTKKLKKWRKLDHQEINKLPNTYILNR